MKKFAILTIALIMGTNVLSAQNPCTKEVIEAARREVINYVKNMKVDIISNHVDAYSSTHCITFKPNSMSVDEFILLNEYLEENPICAELISNNANAECHFTQMISYQDGVYCNHIYYRNGKGHQYKTLPVPDDRVRYALEQQIKTRKERLRLLKEQQHYLNIDNAKLITDALISEIPSSKIKELDKLLRDVMVQLQKAGINKLSKYYDIDYEPSENETADLVRKIISPIDEILDQCHISSAKFIKYLEALKLTPDAGMILGNTAAFFHFYIKELDLKKEIADLEQRLEELKKPSGVAAPKEGPYEQRYIYMSGSM